MMNDYTADTANLAMNSTAVSQPRRSINTAAAEKAAKEYEGVFISQMLKEMYAGVSTNSEFGGGAGEDMFRSLTIDEYGKKIAANGGFGLAKHILSELIAVQERAS